MATTVLTNCKMYVDGIDASGDTNKLTLSLSAAEKDVTTFGSGGSMERRAGLKDIKFTHEGFVNISQTVTQDSVETTQIGASPFTTTVAPLTGAVAERSYFGQIVSGGYNRTLAVGDPFTFSMDGGGTGTWLAGQILQSSATALATGNGTAVQVGAVSAAQMIYVAVNCIAVSGTASPTLTILIKSAAASNLSGATTRVTVPNITAIGGTYCVPVAGAVTDTWWTANVAITGTTPSFTAIVSVAIQ